MTDSPENTAARRLSDEARTASKVVERNVRALVELAAERERARSTGDRIASAISGFAGSMKFVYFHAVAFGLWLAMERAWIPTIGGFHLTFGKLGSIASVEAIFLATFVLIAQNRMKEHEETRNHLDVQVSLVNERETTHILRLVAAMSDKMGLEGARDPEIRELVRDLEPKDVIDRIAVESDAVDTRIRNDRWSTGR